MGVKQHRQNPVNVLGRGAGIALQNEGQRIRLGLLRIRLVKNAT